MSSKRLKWLALLLLPFLYVGSYMAYRATHIYESYVWELNPGVPRWAINFDISTPFGYVCFLAFRPLAMMDMSWNNVALSRAPGEYFYRDGVRLHSKARRPTSHASFLTTVEQLLVANGEVLAVIDSPNGGGVSSYEIFTSFEEFRTRLAELRPTTKVLVHGDLQLPIRGHVDNTFIKRALAEIRDRADWVIVSRNDSDGRTRRSYEGNSHTELESTLRECFEEDVCVGYRPNWWAVEADGDISGIVPNPDGTVTVAAFQ